MRTTLKLLAPYLSVAVFWLGARDGVLTLASYHAQILLWAWIDRTRLRLGGGGPWSLAWPMLGAGPLLYFLLPVIARTDTAVWLRDYDLAGWALLVLVPWFGLLHPLLEQVHWQPLRERTRLAHPVFAGYHVLVLFTLLGWPWLLLSAGVLVAASVVWRYMWRRSGGLVLPVASHVFADLGVIVAALLLAD